MVLIRIVLGIELLVPVRGSVLLVMVTVVVTGNEKPGKVIYF
jgi:hypothetical protein